MRSGPFLFWRGAAGRGWGLGRSGIGGRWRSFLRFSDFVGGIDGEEQIVGQKMFVVIALAVEFHVHFGGPRQPELRIAAWEFHGTIIDEEMIAGEFKFAVGLGQVGLDAQDVKRGRGNPETALDGKIEERAIALPKANSGAG